MPRAEPLAIETSGLFQRLSFDFVGPLPKSRQGNAYIIVAIEHLTSWPVAKAVPSITAMELCRFIISSIITVFGCPYQMLSDRGTQMTSAIYADVMRLLGAAVELTTPYHPAGNGKCERFNGTLGAELKKMCSSDDRWDEVLDLALFAYRVRPGCKGLSPFRLMHGVDPRLPIDVLEPLSRSMPMIDNLLMRRLGLSTAALERLRLPEVELATPRPRLQVGDRVFCLRTEVMAKRASGLGVPKFTPLLQGPLLASKQVRPKLYRLCSEDGTRHSRSLVHEDRLILAPARASVP